MHSIPQESLHRLSPQDSECCRAAAYTDAMRADSAHPPASEILRQSTASHCPAHSSDVDRVAGSAAAVRTVDAARASTRRYRLARRQRRELATLLHRRKSEVIVVVLPGDDAAMNLVRSRRARIERAVMTQRESQRMIRRIDLDDRAIRTRNDCVRIGARSVRATSQYRRLREELHTEASRRGEDAVHANAWRRRRSLVAAEHRLQHVGLHRLDTNACALGGQVQRGAGRAAR